MVKVDATLGNFGGRLYKLSHESKTLAGPANFNVFLPSKATVDNKKVPVLMFLSGLTCTPQNCTEKGFLQAEAEKQGIALLWPDTSPRGEGVPDDKEYDFGQGAGFYLTATQEPWSKHFKMDKYVTGELLDVVKDHFADSIDVSKISITGHSMGGHGALSLFLKNPGFFKSVSAFAPICNPVACPWGQKAFAGYLGGSKDAPADSWYDHDSTYLIKKYKGPTPEILLDVGTSDPFYISKQLLPENLQAAAQESVFKDKLHVRYHPEYDHSYFFISSFAKDHVAHAAKYLLANE